MIINNSSNIRYEQAAKREFNLKEEVKKFHLPEDKEDAVYGSVAWAAGYKGYPYSETEFNCESAQIGWKLEEKHGSVTAKIYEYLLAQMPAKGGRFNPYSGD